MSVSFLLLHAVVLAPGVPARSDAVILLVIEDRLFVASATITRAAWGKRKGLRPGRLPRFSHSVGSGTRHLFIIPLAWGACRWARRGNHASGLAMHSPAYFEPSHAQVDNHAKDEPATGNDPYNCGAWLRLSGGARSSGTCCEGTGTCFHRVRRLRRRDAD